MAIDNQQVLLLVQSFRKTGQSYVLNI